MCADQSQPNGTFLGQSNVNHAGSTVTLATTGNSFVQQPFNFAKTETSGIDFDVSYRTSVSPSVDLSLRAVASYVIKRNNFTNINDPTFSNRQKSELGDSTWRGRLSMTLDFGRWDFGYQLQYIGRQTIATEYETQLSHQGRAPTNPDAFPVIWFPQVFTTASVWVSTWTSGSTSMRAWTTPSIAYRPTTW